MPFPGGRVFIGRRRELGELSAALAGAAAGRGALFLIVGEPGIGKTCLAGELAARAAEGGIPALWGRCWEAEARPPYWPWIQLLRQVSVRLAADAGVATLGSGREYLARIVPELRSSFPALASVGSLESDSARSLLFDAAATFVKQAAASTPLLLLLDDLHWADLPSLRLLEFIAGEVLDAPVLVVGTYRHVEARQEPGVAASFNRLARKAHHLSLSGLSEPEVGLVIEMASGQSAPEAVVHAIHSQTEGNPFFVDEVVRGYRARAGERGWTLPDSAGVPISHGLRGAIRERLAPLSAEPQRIMAAAAVIGRDFDVSFLAALCEITPAELLEVLAVPLEHEIVARVLDTPGRYRFSHALIREAVYEELPPQAKTALHRKLGQLLEEHHAASVDPPLSELAHHFFEGVLGGDEHKAVEYAERAGRQAMELLGYEEAVAQYRRAVQLLDLVRPAEPQRQAEVLLALGAAHDRAGQHDEARRTLDRAASIARRLGSSALLADVALHRCELSGLIWTEFGRTHESLIQDLEEALVTLGEDAGVRRARVLARLATELCWTGEGTRPDGLSREAVEIARAAGEAGTLAYALLGRLHCVSGPDHVEERAGIVREILALADTGVEREISVNALMWRVGDSLQLGDQAALRSSTAALVQRVEQLRQPPDLWIVPTLRSQAALLEGRFAEAERLCQEIVGEPSSRSNAAQVASALLFLIRREQGRLGELEEGLKSLAAGYPDVAVWRASLALLYAEVGRDAEARAEIAALSADAPRLIRRDLTWLYTMSCLAQACAACAGPQEAAPLYAALRPYEDRNVVTGPFFYLGPVAHYLALLAAQTSNWTDAERHFDEAESRSAALGAQPWVARSLVAHARMRRRRGAAGDAAAAAEMLRRVLAIAEPLAMESLSRAAAVDLEALGDASTSTAEPRTDAALRREGDYWTLVHDGKVHRLRDVKGFRYLARLLREPGREFHVLDLLFLVRDESSVGVLGEGAKLAYARRLDGLRARLDEAEKDNDPSRAEAARTEIETIAVELAAAVGLEERDQAAGVVAERARASVTKAIRKAIRVIGSNDAELSRALSRSVLTGVYCRYEPVPNLRLRWQL